MKNIPVHPAAQPGWSETFTEVAMSAQFLGWIFALGDNVRILGPAEVVEEFREVLKQVGTMYK